MIPQDEIFYDSILQWNINGLKAKTNELKQLISQHNPFIVALNETRSNTPKIIIENSFKNYSIYYDSNLHQGNVILIRKDINYIPVSLNSCLNAIAIEIRINNHDVRVCSIYMSPY